MRPCHSLTHRCPDSMTARKPHGTDDVKHVLPLITALLLALYVSLPGPLDAYHDPSVASVTELQDEFVSSNPRHDDPAVVPVEAAFHLPPLAQVALHEHVIQQPDYKPSVPNIRDPPCSFAA